MTVTTIHAKPKNKRQKMRLLTLFLLTAFVACFQPKDVSHTVATKPEPDTVSLKTLPVYASFNDLEPLFNQRNDTTYLINFWATWCKPCVAEMPYFEAFHAAHRDEAVRVVLVSLDFPKQYQKTLVPFINKRDLQPEVAALADGDYNSWIDRVDPEWDGAIPATYVYRGSKSNFAAREFHSLEEVEQFVAQVQ